MWIVMTSSAKMPSSCWGRYRNVYVAELKSSWDYPVWSRPEHIRSWKIKQYRHLGHHSVGTTARCSYAKACERAEAIAHALNNAKDAEGEAVVWMSWGGSA